MIKKGMTLENIKTGVKAQVVNTYPMFDDEGEFNVIEYVVNGIDYGTAENLVLKEYKVVSENLNQSLIDELAEKLYNCRKAIVDTQKDEQIAIENNQDADHFGDIFDELNEWEYLVLEQIEEYGLNTEVFEKLYGKEAA